MQNPEKCTVLNGQWTASHQLFYVATKFVEHETFLPEAVLGLFFPHMQKEGVILTVLKTPVYLQRPSTLGDLIHCGWHRFHYGNE